MPNVDLAWTLRSVAFVQEEMLRIKRAFIKISVFVNYLEQMPDVPRSNKELDRIHATTAKEPYQTERSLGQGFGYGLIVLGLELIQTSAPGKSMHDYACHSCQIRYTSPLLFHLIFVLLAHPLWFLPFQSTVSNLCIHNITEKMNCCCMNEVSILLES